ncbi:MAG: metallophosphoesterase [Clostridia bacterium]|nr:metallophosphoesterase [Clostridia bacterium]
MKPIRTKIHQNGIRFVLKAEAPLYKISKGKLCKNLFLSSLRIPYIGSNVKVIKENETSAFIGKLNPDGSYDSSPFKILTFTDMHTGEDYELNDKVMQLMIDNIEEIKPDLVIFTGDCIQAKFQQIDAVQFGQLFEKMGVYWAYTFGNHEAREEKEYYKYLLFKSITDCPYCLSKFGDPALFGYGNYVINVMNSENEIRQSLVMFDSGRDICEPHKTNDNVTFEHGYDYIKPTQIEWYKKEITALKEKYGQVKSCLYMHIPIPEYAEVFGTEKGADEKYIPTGKAELVYGVQYELPGCSPYNSGLFTAMKEMGAQAVFSGHDHVNDWAAIYEGIYLVYSQSSDYNLYGLGGYNNAVYLPESEWLQGCTLTTINNDATITIEQKKNSRFLK